MDVTEAGKQTTMNRIDTAGGNPHTGNIRSNKICGASECCTHNQSLSKIESSGNAPRGTTTIEEEYWGWMDGVKLLVLHWIVWYREVVSCHINLIWMKDVLLAAIFPSPISCVIWQSCGWNIRLFYVIQMICLKRMRNSRRDIYGTLYYFDSQTFYFN